ncbi:MAG: hypothetical protein GY754_40995 [bacterium]|nr:hypothetical protein [bacterium]
MPKLQDHNYLINTCVELLNNPENKFSEYKAGDSRECKKIGFGKNKKGNAYIVMADETAVELGSPKTKSLTRVLWTKTPGITSDRIWIAGKDLPEILSQQNGSSVSFLLFIILQLGNENDPTDIRLQGLKNLTNKIPGFMTRSITGKMWIRIHKSLMKKKFSLYSLGQSLYETYKESIPGIEGIDIILAADDPALIAQFEPVFEAAKIICGENQKLQWEEDGVVSCEELNCDVCEEQPTCDTIRDIVIKKKKERKQQG